MSSHTIHEQITHQLVSNGSIGRVYQVSTEDATTVIARHGAFLTDQGIAIDPSSQAIPYYVGCPKMHKDPVDMRFISSSASSSMKCISVWINRALNGMQREVDILFADSMQSLHPGLLDLGFYRMQVTCSPSYMHGIQNMLMPLLHTLTYSLGTFSAYTLTFS